MRLVHGVRLLLFLEMQGRRVLIGGRVELKGVDLF
jgi:hypothetical protein